MKSKMLFLMVSLVFAVFIISQVSASSTLLNGLRSYYTFNETSGTTARDLTGLGDATETQIAENQPGKLGTAWRTKNASARVDLTGNNYESTSYSVNFWFNGTLSQGYIFSYVVRDNSNNYYGYGLNLDGSGHIQGENENAGSPNDGTASSTAVNDGNYHMLSLTYDSATQNMTTYIDGSIAKTDGGIPPPNFNSVKKGALGGWYYNNGSSFDAKQPYSFDELGIWNRSLTASEISLLYNSTFGFSYPFVSPDNTAPKVQLVEPTENNSAVLNRPYIQVNATASDETSLKNVTVNVYNDTGGNTYIFVRNATAYGGNYSFNNNFNDNNWSSFQTLFTFNISYAVPSNASLGNWLLSYYSGSSESVNPINASIPLASCLTGNPTTITIYNAQTTGGKGTYL